MMVTNAGTVYPTKSSIDLRSHQCSDNHKGAPSCPGRHANEDGEDLDEDTGRDRRDTRLATFCTHQIILQNRTLNPPAMPGFTLAVGPHQYLHPIFTSRTGCSFHKRLRSACNSEHICFRDEAP